MASKERKILSLLEKIAAETERVSNARISAAVVYKRDVIAIGTNKLKTHPFQAQFAKHEESVYWHAENRALHDARKRISARRLSKCTLYVCRIDQDHNYCLARPCDGCMKTINSFKLKELVYTTHKSFRLEKLA